MPVAHAYVTFVADSENGLYGDVGTINPEALADQDLATALRAGDYKGFISGLAELGEENAELELQVRQLDAPLEWLSQDELPGHLAAFLSRDQLDDAAQAWYSPLERGDPRTEFAVNLLDSTALAEYSDAAARKAAGVVGAAAAGAYGTIAVALVTAGQVGALAILIASPVGLVAVGAGAAYCTYLLLRGKRRNS